MIVNIDEEKLNSLFTYTCGGDSREEGRDGGRQMASRLLSCILLNSIND